MWYYLHKDCWPSNRTAYHHYCILIALYDTMSFPWKCHIARQSNYMLVILDWLPVQSSRYGVGVCLFFQAILGLLSTDLMQKLRIEILTLITSVVFVRHLMGFFRKIFFILCWGKNLPAAKSASLFNGKLSYFAKVLPKTDACS